MLTRFVKTFWVAVLLVFGLTGFNAIAVAADAPENFQVIDGVAIYQGVMPTQIVQNGAWKNDETGATGIFRLLGTIDDKSSLGYGWQKDL